MGVAGKIGTGVILIGVIVGLVFVFGNTFSSFSNVQAEIFEECDINDKGNVLACHPKRNIIESTVDPPFGRQANLDVIYTFANYRGDTPSYVAWLWFNGYRQTEGGDFGGSIGIEDVRFNSKIKNSLEQGTTCTLKADLNMYSGEGLIEGTGGKVDIAEDDFDPDHEIRSTNLMESTVSKQALNVDLRDGFTFCRFKFRQFLDESKAIPGNFTRWANSHNPGFDEAELKVKYNVDNDQDGVLNTEDDCPGTMEGIQVNSNGCEFSQTTPGSGSGGDVTKRTLWVPSGDFTCTNSTFQSDATPDPSFESKDSCLNHLRTQKNLTKLDFQVLKTFVKIWNSITK